MSEKEKAVVEEAVKRPKQTEMEGPGISRVKVAEVEEAADEYEAVRDRRMALTEKEVEAKAKLRMLMEKHLLTVYVFDEGGEKVTVTCQPEIQVKVKRDKGKKEKGED